MDDYPKDLRNGTKEEFLFHVRMMRKERDHRIGCLRNIIIFVILLLILVAISYLKSKGML